MKPRLAGSTERTRGETTNDARHETVFANHQPHLCPWWLGWALASPLRRLWLGETPTAVLGDFIQPGDRVLEVGPGSGFFTLPMAERVGPEGSIVCVDVQPKMLATVRRKADAKGLGSRVVTRVCGAEGLAIDDLAGTFDKAVLLHMLHEAPNPPHLLVEGFRALRPGGGLLLVEPSGHCSPELWAAELWAAEKAGFTRLPSALWPALEGRQARVFVRGPSA